MNMNLSKLQEVVEDRGAWWATFHGVAESRAWFSDWTGTQFVRGFRLEQIVYAVVMPTVPLGRGFNKQLASGHILLLKNNIEVKQVKMKIPLCACVSILKDFSLYMWTYQGQD